jgi:phosphohistidine phosphatase
MRLMLLRHAKAEKAEPGMRDRERRLTPRGCDDAQRIGAYMAHHALTPDLALVSPAQRARQTWEFLLQGLQEGLGSGSTQLAVDFDEGLYNASARSGLEILMESGGTAGALLVIGHNPGLHEIAGLLIAAGDVEARERLNEGLPTAGLAVIDFAGNDWRALHPRSGRLERFVTPRLIKAVTD